MTARPHRPLHSPRPARAGLPWLTLLIAGCGGAPTSPPTVVMVAPLERDAAPPAPPPPDPRPAACRAASPCIEVRLADEGWEVEGARVASDDLQAVLSQHTSAPDGEPDAPFKGIVWADLPAGTPYPRWTGLMKAVGNSRAIDVVVSEGPRVVPALAMRHFGSSWLLMVAEPSVAYVTVSKDGAPTAQEWSSATPDDVVEVARRLCGAPAPCWNLIAFEPDTMSFGELTRWLTALQPLLYKGRAVRIGFDNEWATTLKRH